VPNTSTASHDCDRARRTAEVFAEGSTTGRSKAGAAPAAASVSNVHRAPRLGGSVPASRSNLDNQPVGELGFELSVEVTAAVWIADRLTPPECGVVTSVVPGGFEAYARVLYSLRGSGIDPGRWSDVAKWSGVELVPGDQFPDIALPEHEPVEAEPWPGRVPEIGTLYPPDAVALGDVLAGHTTTPSRCWFGVWEGWASSTHAPGPRVQLPWRDYVLFVGPPPGP
jgi:hypothetical protein